MLGQPERHFRAIHIGGTNGKGSVAAMTASVLERAGRRVGLYTSPHLVDVRERMLVNGRPISSDAFCNWTDLLRDDIVETEASFFEATTAIAFADFAARGVDVAVIEVGLGGRLDSTNVVEPLVNGVVSVGLDHTEYLGDSLESIAREKAGIAKPGVPFVIGESDGATAAVLKQVAEEAGAEVHMLASTASYGGDVGMVGRYQRRNAVIAEKMLSLLPPDLVPSSQHVERGIAAAWLPGRFDRRGKWLFDVAHNLRAMEELASCVGEARLPRPIHAVLGMLGDKDAVNALRALQPQVDAIWYTVPPSVPRERRPDPNPLLGDDGLNVVHEPDFVRALELAQDGAGTVLVTGSFHTVGDTMSRLPGFAPLG